MANPAVKKHPKPFPEPADRHVFVVCTGESCAEAGSWRLLDELRHACPVHGRHMRVGASRCIGRCAMAPAVIEDGYVLGWVSRKRLKVELIRLGLEGGDSGAGHRNRKSVAAG